MIKTMVFIDGMWLYRNTPKLGEKFGSAEFHVDYGKLPLVLSSQVGAHLSVPTLDTVRTYLFASYPKNYDVTDEDVVQRQLDFFAMLKEEFHYEVELFPINFRGRHIRREDRSPTDKFEPEEKCVDVALATAMLYFAAIPYAYDVAIAVIGDRDYMPVLQHVRRLGKRVGIASIKGACASEYSDAEDTAKLRDMDIIWLDDVLDQIVLRFERQQLECQDPRHRGDRKVWTTFRPRRGRPFYCDACRKRNAEEKAKAEAEFVAADTEVEGDKGDESFALSNVSFSGFIKALKRDSGYGFIKGPNAKDYFFHLNDLEGLEYDKLQEGQQVIFLIRKEPKYGKAGAATRVRSAF